MMKLMDTKKVRKLLIYQGRFMSIKLKLGCAFRMGVFSQLVDVVGFYTNVTGRPKILSETCLHEGC